MALESCGGCPWSAVGATGGSSAGTWCPRFRYACCVGPDVMSNGFDTSLAGIDRTTAGNIQRVLANTHWEDSAMFRRFSMVLYHGAVAYGMFKLGVPALSWLAGLPDLIGGVIAVAVLFAASISHACLAYKLRLIPDWVQNLQMVGIGVTRLRD